MSKRNDNFESIEFLLLDEIAESYLKEALCILNEKLDNSAKDALKENKVFLNVCLSPANTIHNFRVPDLKANSKIHLVTIDFTVIKYCKFDTNEIAATILHEFGHIFNHYNKQSKSKIYEQLKKGLVPDFKQIEHEKNEINKKKEFYADYYPKKFGLGKSMKSSLKKYLESNLPFALEKEREINERIEKLNTNEIFNGTTKQLR